MRAFLCAATMGKGTVPVLPEEVRRHIWSFTYPRPILWCAVCSITVMIRTMDGREHIVNTHPCMWLDTPRCHNCCGYPHLTRARSPS